MDMFTQMYVFIMPHFGDVSASLLVYAKFVYEVSISVHPRENLK